MEFGLRYFVSWLFELKPRNDGARVRGTQPLRQMEDVQNNGDGLRLGKAAAHSAARAFEKN